MFTKGLLVAVVLIQLIIAVETTGSIRSLAELSAFLLVVGIYWNQHHKDLTEKPC